MPNFPVKTIMLNSLLGPLLVTQHHWVLEKESQFSALFSSTCQLMTIAGKELSHYVHSSFPRCSNIPAYVYPSNSKTYWSAKTNRKQNVEESRVHWYKARDAHSV